LLAKEVLHKVLLTLFRSWGNNMDDCYLAQQNTFLLPQTNITLLGMKKGSLFKVHYSTLATE